MQATKSAVINPVTKQAVATLGPSSSAQIWAPSLVTVTTQIDPVELQFPPAPYLFSPNCTLYRGPGGSNVLDSQGKINPSLQYVDDTTKGSGDSSSILAGTLLQPGEFLTAVWDNTDQVFNTFTNAAITVFGRTFDNMEEVQGNLSPIPGAKFSGNTSNALPWDYGTEIQSSAQLLGIGYNQVYQFTKTNVELVSVKFRIQTSATVGNRSYGIIAADAGELITCYHTNGLQSASLQREYTFSPGGSDWNTGASSAVSPIGRYGNSFSPGIILPGGTTFAIDSTTDGAVAPIDTLQYLEINYKQYRNVSKAGFV